MQEHQILLVEELNRRRKCNRHYSMRSFARFLQISPSHLCLLISGKKNLTRKQATKIADKLSLSPSTAHRLLAPPLMDLRSENQQRLLSEDEFLLLSDWHHFAILSLGKLKKNKCDPDWIAKKLSISKFECIEALQRLSRMGLIEINKTQFKQTGIPLTTSSDRPSAAIRKYHKQNLDLAKEKLDTVGVKERDFSSITMAVNPDKIEKVKNMIEDFRQRICDELEQGDVTQVYTLSIQLFPLTSQESQ